MSEGRVQGASSREDAARRALRGLVVAATVRIHRQAAGYGLEEPETFLGSGFFVAPNWVLTCAHVACGGEGGEVVVVYRSAPGSATAAVRGRVVATVPERAGQPLPSGNWPAPDLALVQLAEPVDDHECVYVSERPAAYFGDERVLYAGWTFNEGRLRVMDGTLTVQGTIGGWADDVQMRLGDNDLPYGVSGGPVIDPVRGEVIGVLKARSDHRPGGTSTGIEQLRALRVPSDAVGAEHDDLYQAVFHAHDRYHRDRQRHPSARAQTWTDVQGRLDARPGRTLTPDERVQLLGRLADLPPPASTRGLLDILDALPDFQGPTPLPAPRGWRDGLGALYESARDDGALELVLDYAMRALSAERPFTAASTSDAEEALWDWVWQAAQRLTARYRAGLADQRIARHRARTARVLTPTVPGAPRDLGVPKTPDTISGTVPGVPETPSRARENGAAPTPAHPVVLLEILPRPWEPDRCDWSVSVLLPAGAADRLPGAERTPVADLPGHLGAPLAEAFRRCDEPGRPALLQVAVPQDLLALEIDTWRLAPHEEPLGAQRPVVVRVAGREQLEDDPEYDDPGDVDEERRARWRWLHAHHAQAELLDCDDGLRVPVPTVEELRALSYGTVPVLCRYGDQRYEDDAAALARIVRGGYGVALWRRRGGRPDAVCGEFHRGAVDEVARPAGAARLPELVHDLRARLRAGRTETYWADGIALLYDDPHHPLPGTGDLLEAP